MATTKSKLNQQIDYQQRVNEAVQQLLKHFGEEVPLQTYYMYMAKAQTQIMSMKYTLNRVAIPDKVEGYMVPDNDIVPFFDQLSMLFDMLEKLDELSQPGRYD